jgi:hypothetical protein
VEWFLNLLLNLFPIAVGYVVLNALLSHAYKLSGGHWRVLALTYPMPEGRVLATPLASRLFEMIELHEGDDDPKLQTFWVIARIFPDGVAISMPPLPGLAYPSIFITVSDLSVGRRQWRDRDDAFAIAAPCTPALSIMIGDALAGHLAALRAPPASLSPRV